MILPVLVAQLYITVLLFCQGANQYFFVRLASVAVDGPVEQACCNQPLAGLAQLLWKAQILY